MNYPIFELADAKIPAKLKEIPNRRRNFFIGVNCRTGIINASVWSVRANTAHMVKKSAKN